MLSFRHYHTLELLKGYHSSKRPLDAFIRDYLKTHTAIGSKDRNAICKTLYFLIKNLSLIDSYLTPPISWEKRLDFVGLQEFKDQDKKPLHILYSCPKWLFDLLKNQYSDDELRHYLKVSIGEAPLTIRVNLAKTSKQALELELSQTYQLQSCLKSPLGLKFFKREPLTAHPLYKSGHFEIQDEASQLACMLPTVHPGDHILDYCAGSGGKALALAPYLKAKGLIYVHDIRDQAIKESKKRFERAGIHHVQFFDSKNRLSPNLKHQCDLVIVDVPCSGTGTFRRNPDLKWKLSKQALDELVSKQQDIFTQALEYLKPGGAILYSTCSVLNIENQDQIAYFLKRYPQLKLTKELILMPQDGGHDGFFAALLYLADKG